MRSQRSLERVIPVNVQHEKAGHTTYRGKGMILQMPGKNPIAQIKSVTITPEVCSQA